MQTQDKRLEQILDYARDDASRGMVDPALRKLKEAREYAAKVGLDIFARVQEIEAGLKK